MMSSDLIGRPRDPRAFPDWHFSTLDFDYHASTRSAWLSFKKDGAPCFTLQTLADMADARESLRGLFAYRGLGDFPIDYVALASNKSGIFNLGGDLALFARSVRDAERDTLHNYARACIDIMYGMISAYDLPVVTVAVITGQALGGGFEAALAQDFLIADETAVLGVPEIAFNTFPGMGAITLLTRRVGAPLTERIVTSGAAYSATDLAEQDVIDVLASPGLARDTALAWMIDGGRRTVERRLAITRTRRKCLPVSLNELIGIVDIWTDCSYAMTPRDVRHMEKLLAAQKRWAA